jgi:non-ribosomal peptide synthetase-like protein
MPEAMSKARSQSNLAMDRAPSARPSLLHGFFEAAAERWPGNVAIDVPPSATRPHRVKVTYAELRARAAALAWQVYELASEDCVAAILLPRTSELVYVAQVGVLMAGAAHACLDPSFPDAQVEAVLEDALPICILTDSDGAERLRGLRMGRPGPPVIDLTRSPQGCMARRGPSPPWLSGKSLAYVIFTSGTTGKPKGVMIEHAAISNLILGEHQDFPVTPSDRVAQSSSCAYDSSIDEAWMALSSGAALVVMDDEAARLGPDLPGWLAREGVTIFCPTPTLLRSAGKPDLQRVLPRLRRVLVGGEPLPEDVAAHWSGVPELVNDYGPTECSVVALRGRITPGGPIHIGAPVPGIAAWVLDDQMREAPPGVTGEIYLGGAGLARGYRNDPELTARKFIVHPEMGRVYRTGDLGSRDARGLFRCLGRVDSQVKVRGHRIELEAIEACLARQPGIREAACALQGQGGTARIVAFIVPDAPGEPPRLEDLRELLRRELPEHAIPGHILALDHLPRSLSGKLDRRKLPAVQLERLEGVIVPPRTPAEQRVVEAFREALGMQGPVSVGHDFFHHLGGDSLRAALAISILRRSPDTCSLTVRDLYEARTAEALARRASAEAPGPPPTPRERRRGWPVLATVAQTLFLLAGLYLVGPAAYLLASQAGPEALHSLGIAGFLLITPIVAAVLTGLYLIGTVSLAVALKWALIGRYRPRREPVWGSFHVRNWMVTMAARAIPWRLLSETVFQNAVLRLLGARIGRRVHIHRGVNLLHGGWDLLDLGDDVTLSRDVALRVIDFHDGEVIAAGVSIGAGATLEVRAGVGGGARVGPGAYLTSHSFLPPGAEAPAGECWSGIPASRSGPSPAPPRLDETEAEATPWLQGLAITGGRMALSLSASVPLALLALSLAWGLGVDEVAAVEWMHHPTLEPGALALLGLALAAYAPLSLIGQCLTMRALGRVREGVIRRWGWGYVRVVLKADLADSANEWLSGTLMWPMWLRGAGMAIGKRTEVSTVFDTVPELTEIAEDSFLADGAYLGGPAIHRGTVTLARTRLGKKVFLGNYAVAPCGATIPDGVLLGVCTVAPAAAMTPGTSWFGHPPFELPKREEPKLNESLTYRPSWIRYLNRVFWEQLRFTLALPPAALGLGAVYLALLADDHAPLWAMLAFVVPGLELAYLASLCTLAVALKWALLGKVRPGTHPLWSCWCSRWDFNYTAWHHWAQGPASALEGTLWMNAYLRALGVRIGKHVVISDALALVVDPDMIECQDDVTSSALFQAHTFEDRELKLGQVSLKERSTVGSAALLLYGAEVGEGASALGNSVVMKHERLLPGQAYAGSPTRPIP